VEKERLIKEKKIKPDKKKGLDKSHYEKKVPFEVPENWEWLKIKDVFFINPKNDLDDNLDVSFIPMQLISDEFTNEHKSEIRKWKDVKRGFTHFREGDIAVAKITPCFENRKSVILNNLEHHFGAGTTELHILRPILEPLLVNYTLCLIKSEYFINYGVSHFSGAVGQQRVGKNILEETWFPLPPLSEQNRIVAEVERLFELIDVIEESKRSLEQVIKQTKSKILGLALSGKLVPQNPEEEPASMLLERLRKNNKLKKTSDKSHYPFELPNGWEVTEMQNICSLLDGEKRNDISLPYLDVKFLRNQSGINLKKSGKFVSAETNLVLVDGENSGEIFKTNIDGYQGSTLKIIQISEEINEEYIFYILKKEHKLFKESKTGSAIPHLNKKLFREYPIPLPPLAEQQRIVSQIEKIFAQLEIIEDSLKA
jgi:type I restriction enzyme S subunit